MTTVVITFNKVSFNEALKIWNDTEHEVILRNKKTDIAKLKIRYQKKGISSFTYEYTPTVYPKRYSGKIFASTASFTGGRTMSKFF